jgi:predicted membrane protein (TIGR00267 family)
MSAIRYVTRGFIDGSLSTLGIVLGAAVGGDPKVIMAAGLGGGIANAISNLLGALTAEKAGVMIELDKYEKAMVGSNVKLKDTKIYEKHKKRIWKAGLYDGLTTFLGSVIPVFPFALFVISDAIIASIITTLSLLFALGIYLGRISKENIIWAGTKMALFGGVTALLAMSLEFFFK